MPEGPDGKTIIIIKKVSGHGGHHGGAWKVAFADFVALARDVLRRCVSNLTPYVFLSGFVAAGIGVALVLVSRVACRSGLSGKVAR